MEKENFKERYHKANTFGEAMDLVDSLSGEDLIKLRDSLEVIKEFMGLDMRADFTLGLITSRADRIIEEGGLK